MTRLVAVALLAVLPVAGGASLEQLAEQDGYAKLRDHGRPTPGPIAARYGAGGVVTVVDARSITVREANTRGVENAKRADYAETAFLSRWVRMDPAKPIVLMFPGWEVDIDRCRCSREGMVVTLLTGDEVTLRTADQPTRTYPAAQNLRDGAPLPRVRLRDHLHLLPDVRVGDRVSLTLDGPLGREECIAVNIYRRPGGRVPYPAHRNDPEMREDIDMTNAHQAFEEHGTPIPERFRPDRDFRLLMGTPDPPPPAKRP